MQVTGPDQYLPTTSLLKVGDTPWQRFPREALPDDWHSPEEIVIFLSSGYYVLLHNHFLNFNVQPLTGGLCY